MTAAPSLRLLRVADRLRRRRARGRDRDRAARERPVMQVASRWLWLAAALLATLALAGAGGAGRRRSGERLPARGPQLPLALRRPHPGGRPEEDQRAARERQEAGLPAPGRRGRHAVRPRRRCRSCSTRPSATRSSSPPRTATTGSDELLVVMPKGYGIYKAKNLPAGDKAVIAKLPAPTGKTGPDAGGCRRDGDPGARGAARAQALDRRQQRAGKQLVGLGRARRDRRRGDPDRRWAPSRGGCSGGAGRRAA